jgi:SH3-like domain-containing protein
VIASHYAEPLTRALTAPAQLLADPNTAAEVLAELRAGEQLRMLDCTRGWAWGYAGGRVGYVRSEAF